MDKSKPQSQRNEQDWKKIAQRASDILSGRVEPPRGNGAVLTLEQVRALGLYDERGYTTISPSGGTPGLRNGHAKSKPQKRKET